MDRLDMVIKALESCTLGNGTDINCPSCPYYNAGCVKKLIDDDLDLLRGMKHNNTMLIWIEERDRGEIISAYPFMTLAGHIGLKLNNNGVENEVFPLVTEYGIRWRAWSSKPTESDIESHSWA